MSQTKDDLKAKLLLQAQATIEQLLSDERLSEHMTLSDIEDVVGASEIDFRQRVLDEIVDLQQVEAVNCAECGGRLRNKGKHNKRIVTLRGETDIRRAYYQCGSCGKGYFPPR